MAEARGKKSSHSATNLIVDDTENAQEEGAANLFSGRKRVPEYRGDGIRGGISSAAERGRVWNLFLSSPGECTTTLLFSSSRA